MSLDAFKSSDHEFNAERERQDGAALSRHHRMMNDDWDESEAYGDDYCVMCGRTGMCEPQYGELICKCGHTIRFLEDEDED